MISLFGRSLTILVSCCWLTQIIITICVVLTFLVIALSFLKIYQNTNYITCPYKDPTACLYFKQYIFFFSFDVGTIVDHVFSRFSWLNACILFFKIHFIYKNYDHYFIHYIIFCVLLRSQLVSFFKSSISILNCVKLTDYFSFVKQRQNYNIKSLMENISFFNKV